MQCINDIDVLPAYLHVRRTGCYAGCGDGRSKRRLIEREAQSANRRAWGGSTIKRTRIADIAEGRIRLPFFLVINQVRDIILIFAAAINHLITHQHRVFLVGLIARLNTYRHIGVISEGHRVAAWVCTIIEQAVLLQQIAPREDRCIGFVIHQHQFCAATAGLGKLQPFGAVLALHLLLLVGIVVGIDMNIMIGKQGRVRRMNIGL